MARAVLRGRGEEVGRVLTALRRVTRTGQGAMVVITGEPGIGKTAVLHAATEQAARTGFAVGISKAEEIEQIAPGAPLLVALRSGPSPLLDDAAFDSLAELQDRPLWLVNRVATLLEKAATTTPAVIAIDDVQWADPLTRFALRTLPGRLAASPVVWVITSRLAPAEVVGEVVAAAENAVAVTRVPLGPLPADAVDDLALDHLSGPPDAATQQLLRGVGGNPFWVMQVLDGLTRRREHGRPGDDLRAELLVGVRHRLQALPPDVVALVRVAAVWARGLSADTAGALLGGLPTARVLEALLDASHNGLLAADGAEIVFPHDLFREAVYADVAPAERRALHRACARHIVATEHAALPAAPHFLASATTDDEEAVRALQLAARECLGSMPLEAAELTQRALNLLSPDHPLWLDAGEQALAVLVDIHRESDVVAVADRLLATASDPATIARVQVQACRALWCTEDCREIERRASAALALDGVPHALRARLRAVRVLASARTGSSVTAAENAASVLEDGRRLGDPHAQRLALLTRVESARHEGYQQRALERFGELRPFSVPSHTAIEIRVLQHLDRYDDAETILRRVREDAHDDVDNLLPSLLNAQMWQDHDLARLDEAEAGARTVQGVAAAVGNFAHELDAWTVLTAVAIHRGDVARARRLLAPAERREEASDDTRAARLRITQGWLRAEEGDPDGAVAILRPWLADARRGRGSWPWSPPWTRILAGIGIAAGDSRFAHDAVALAELGATRNPTAASPRGVALQARGLVEADSVLLGKAVDVLRGAPRPLLLSSALADLGAVLLSEGRSAEAVPVLREALAAYERVGAERGVRATAEALGRAGAPVRPPGSTTRRATSGWAALTEAEVRVAELVSAGHTNRSAAAELGVSASTVGTQLRSVFGKLGVRSRVQLTNAFHARRRDGA